MDDLRLKRSSLIDMELIPQGKFVLAAMLICTESVLMAQPQ